MISPVIHVLPVLCSNASKQAVNPKANFTPAFWCGRKSVHKGDGFLRGDDTCRAGTGSLKLIDDRGLDARKRFELVRKFNLKEERAPMNYTDDIRNANSAEYTAMMLEPKGPWKFFLEAFDDASN
jgi:hypothetical protein